MTPRLTTRGRVSRCNMLDFHMAMNMCRPKVALRNSRPSPAERLRQRRKARVAVMRSLDRRDNADLHIAYMMGRCDRQWPQSRGTTTSQLVAMHLAAEDETKE